MRPEPPRGARELAPILFPATMLLVFFVLPFGSMIAVSFFRRDPAAFYEPAFVLDNYARFASAFFGNALVFSVALAAAVAVLCVLVGFPFTWRLVRARRRDPFQWVIERRDGRMSNGRQFGPVKSTDRQILGHPQPLGKACLQGANRHHVRTT